MTNKEFIQKWTDALRENDMSKGPLVPLTGEPTVSHASASYKPNSHTRCAMGMLYELSEKGRHAFVPKRISKFKKAVRFLKIKYRNLIYRLTVDLDEIGIYQ